MRVLTEGKTTKEKNGVVSKFSQMNLQMISEKSPLTPILFLPIKPLSKINVHRLINSK